MTTLKTIIPYITLSLFRGTVKSFHQHSARHHKVRNADAIVLKCKPAAQILADLQDRLQPFPTDVAMAVIEEELQASIGDVFSQLSAEPVAAASLGQVCQPVFSMLCMTACLHLAVLTPTFKLSLVCCKLGTKSACRNADVPVFQRHAHAS